MTDNETTEYALQINSIDQEINSLMLDTALDSKATEIVIYDIGDGNIENESTQLTIRAIMQCESVDENEAKEIFEKINTQLRSNLGYNTEVAKARHGDYVYRCNTISFDEFSKVGFDFSADYEARRMCISGTMVIDYLSITPYGLYASRNEDVESMDELTGQVSSEQTVVPQQAEKGILCQGNGFTMTLPATWDGLYQSEEQDGEVYFRLKRPPLLG